MSVFFSSRKTILKSWLDASSIPCCLSSFFSFFLSQSQQLLDSWWIDRKWFCILDSFLTPDGSIELLFLFLLGCSSTPPRYLYLSKTISLMPSSIDVSIPLDTFICRDLLRVYLSFLMRSDPHFIRSLSLDSSLFFFPKHFHLTPNLILKVSSSFFKIFFTW